MAQRKDDTALLSARNVRKTYHLGKVRVPVLRDASIDIAEGEWVSIVGSSGSGKSTLLHLLGGLDRPDADSGPISFAGDDLRAFGPRRENESKPITFYSLPKIVYSISLPIDKKYRTSIGCTDGEH